MHGSDRHHLLPQPGALPAGKLPHHLLRAWLGRLSIEDPAVVVGPRVGEDAAVLDLGAPELLVVKTDPITFAAEQPGSYLVAVNANDLAAMGAEPRWLLVAALLPEGISAERAESLLEELRAACARAGITLVGGHTEMTVGLDRPILLGCMLGTVARDGLLTSAGVRPGDAIVLAGGVAIEGTAILAREYAQHLRGRGVPEAIVREAAGWLEKPGISVLPAARLLREVGGVHALHDPTEGGVTTALYELAEASGVVLRVRRSAIPVLRECRAICDALALDPLGLLASGALLAAMEPERAPQAVARLEQAGIPAAIVGRAEAGAGGVLEAETGSALPSFARDELARFLESVARN